MADGGSGVRDSSGKPVKSILKTGTHKIVKPSFAENTVDGASAGGGSGIQWDEMNILMTEHPPDKDYGHMKIEEPKTPYHEMIEDDESPTNVISPDDLASRVEEAAADGESEGNKWEQELSDSEGEDEHKQEFKQWRKKHYNEFFAVQRARELIEKDLAEAEAEEAGRSGSGPSGVTVHVTSDDHDTSMQSVSEDMQLETSS